jgi:hypothetical protein
MDRSKHSRVPRRAGVVVEIGAAASVLGAAVWIFKPRAAGVVAVASIEFETNVKEAAGQVAGQVDNIWLGAACWAMLGLALALVCHAGCRALVSEGRG